MNANPLNLHHVIEVYSIYVIFKVFLIEVSNWSGSLAWFWWMCNEGSCTLCCRFGYVVCIWILSSLCLIIIYMWACNM